MDRTPVILAGLGFLGGVTTWMKRLRAAMADHPRYHVRLMHVEVPEALPAADFELHATSVEHARELLRDMGPLVLVPNYAWGLYLAASDPGVKCLAMCHSDSEEEYYLPLSWYETMASHFIAVSPECQRNLAARLPHRAGDVTLLPYGVPVSPTLQRNYQTRPVRVVYAGRLAQPQKRVWDFVPLVEQLVQRNVPFVFDIVGDGSEMAGLKAAFAEKCPHAPVVFHGRAASEAMGRVWAEHDVFVQTSDYEGTSISMLEAMAHGVVPVVTAARSGVAGVIRHGENGSVVPVGDMAAMAEAIAQLAAGPAQLAAAGRAAHLTAQDYAMENYCRRFVDVLDRIMQSADAVDTARVAGDFGGAAPLVQQAREIQRLRADVEWLEKSRNSVAIAGRIPMRGPERTPRRFAFCSTLSAAKWGGSEELWSRAAEALLRDGHEVSVHYPYQYADQPQLERLKLLGAEVFRPAPWRKPFIRGRLGKWLGTYRPQPAPIDAWLDGFQPDFLVASMSYHLDNVEYAFACRNRSIPYSVLVQAANESSFLGGQHVEWYRTAYASASRCYFVSERNRDLTEVNVGIDLSAAMIVDNPFCVDPAAIPLWPASNDPWKIACVGRIDFATKAQDVLLQAMARPQWRERNVQVTLFGSDFGNETQARALIQLYGLERRVKIGGFVVDVENIWRTHHALALPSRAEGNSLAMIEAMFCGRVPIVTNVGRAAALVDDNESGFVAQAATVDLYADALERAWQRRDEWQAIGARAAESIRSRHSLRPAEDFAQLLVEQVRGARRWHLQAA